MTKQIKKIGCSNIKTLIESDKIIINDFNIIERCQLLLKKVKLMQKSCTDDLMMCLVVFGWYLINLFQGDDRYKC